MFDIKSKIIGGIALALAVMLLLSVVYGVKQTLKLSEERAAHAKSKEQFAQAARLQAENLAVTISNYRKQEAIWQAANERIGHETRKRLDAAIADRDAGRSVADSLQRRVADLAACGAGAATPAKPASGSPPAQAPGSLLADVFRRLDEAASGIGAFADSAHIAGLACERSADAVR